MPNVKLPGHGIAFLGEATLAIMIMFAQCVHSHRLSPKWLNGSKMSSCLKWLCHFKTRDLATRQRVRRLLPGPGF